MELRIYRVSISGKNYSIGDTIPYWLNSQEENNQDCYLIKITRFSFENNCCKVYGEIESKEILLIEASGNIVASYSIIMNGKGEYDS